MIFLLKPCHSVNYLGQQIKHERNLDIFKFLSCLFKIQLQQDICPQYHPSNLMSLYGRMVMCHESSVILQSSQTDLENITRSSEEIVIKDIDIEISRNCSQQLFQSIISVANGKEANTLRLVSIFQHTHP